MNPVIYPKAASPLLGNAHVRSRRSTGRLAGRPVLDSTRGVGNTQFPCTRFRDFHCDFVISTVISWFLQRFRITEIQISTLTALRTAWFLFTVMISRQIS